MIAALGLRTGVKVGLLVSILLAALTLAVAARVRIPVLLDDSATNIAGVWRSLPQQLRWLLASDVFIRTCEGMVDVFLVLYAIDVVKISAPRFGVLIAVQTITAMLSYFPAARLADRTGRKPFVVATFLAFALFPVAVVWSHSFGALVFAFIIGGLRELGEPARKALIVDLALPHLRARSVGLYYLLRSVAIAPAAFIGGLLWKISPSVPFYVAGMIGLVGTVVFIGTVDERGGASTPCRGCALFTAARADCHDKLLIG
jgi:MFS family permease